MSLRARLVAGLIALAVVGLVAFGLVTYFEQRSFLLERIDQQATSAVPSVSFELDQAGANVPGFGHHGSDGRKKPPPGFGPAPSRDAALPPGTYGERRDAVGHVVGHRTFGYGQALPAPDLPAGIPVSRSSRDAHLTTVKAEGSSDTRFRVIAVPTGDQPGTTIVAIPMREMDQTLHRLLTVEALVAAAVLLALAALAWVIVRAGLRPLHRMGATADAIAAGDLTRRVSPANARTEVGRLGLALNGMLGQIERAFGARQASEDRLRRFLADASHELRTPLASIRGYAELFRIGAASEPAEAEKAMRRIEEEAARMGVMVEDLLTLARLDEIREPIRRPVDVVRVAGDAVDDARVIAPERPIELEASGPAVVLADLDQLRQVVGNLMRNALVHTPPRTAIDVRVARDADEVVLEVRDHGPGLPTDDADVLFERFWRSEPGRGRGRAGTGLGLAIVAAITEAHGGSVAARNAPDGGASFVIRLPAHGHTAPTDAPQAARA